jgi:hypothetical protein
MSFTGKLGSIASRLTNIILSRNDNPSDFWYETQRGIIWQEPGRMPTFTENARPVQWSAPTMSTLIKRAQENRLYTMDFSALPEIVAGDTVSSVTSVSQFNAANGAVSTDLTITSQAVASGNKGAQCKISGGVDGTTYLLSFKVATVGGYTLIGIGYLYIDDR